MSKYQAYRVSVLDETAPNKEKDKGVEAYGVKGMKSTPWRKKFKSHAEFEKWVDKNDGDYEVQGFRDLNEANDPTAAYKKTMDEVFSMLTDASRKAASVIGAADKAGDQTWVKNAKAVEKAIDAARDAAHRVR